MHGLVLKKVQHVIIGEAVETAASRAEKLDAWQVDGQLHDFMKVCQSRW